MGTKSPVQITSPTQSTLPPNIVLLSTLFPFPDEAIIATVEEFSLYIPQYQRAQFLVQSYFDNGAWRSVPVSPDANKSHM